MSDQTFDHVELRSGAYADSVTLLQVSRAVQAARLTWSRVTESA